VIDVPFPTINRRQLAGLFGGGLSLFATRAFAQQAETTASITTIAPQTAMGGKLATRTEILQGNEPAMLTLDSLRAHDGAIAMYEEIVAGGGWPQVPGGKYKLGSKGARIVTLRQRLVAEGYLPFDALSVEEPETFDDGMAEAVSAFQLNHGIAASGSVNERTRLDLNITAKSRLFALRDNRPRIEAHLEGLGARNILVNLPAAQLETVEFGQVFSRHNVVVGKLERPSPSLNSQVSDIVFNPYWNAPASIVEKDIIPKFLKDPGYLDQMRIRVFDGVGGPEIDPFTVDWVNTAPDRYHFRQEPGEHNALATVKINFPNTHMVYLHDTPHRENFASNARFESSGCVRIDQVRTVINWIMQGRDGFDEGTFEMIAASEEPHTVKIENGPDIRLMYLTAWATDDGRINFRPDIYALDGMGFVLGQPEPSDAI
jgi:murein L,D-transpeptidase YcbB/YkuD